MAILICPFHSYALNFSWNPLALIFGVTEFDATIGLGGMFSVGAMYGIIDADDRTDTSFTKQTGTMFGARGRFFLNGVYQDSLITTVMFGKINTNIEFHQATASGSSVESKGEGEGNWLMGSLGYFWIWPMGFNISSSIGYIYYGVEVEQTSGTNTIKNVPLQGTSPYFDFSFGWNF